jgi:hypothetical protein
MRSAGRGCWGSGRRRIGYGRRLRRGLGRGLGGAEAWRGFGGAVCGGCGAGRGTIMVAIEHECDRPTACTPSSNSGRRSAWAQSFRRTPRTRASAVGGAREHGRKWQLVDTRRCTQGIWAAWRVDRTRDGDSSRKADSATDRATDAQNLPCTRHTGSSGFLCRKNPRGADADRRLRQGQAHVCMPCTAFGYG